MPQGKLDEGIAESDRAIELAPKEAKVWYARGRIYYDLHQYDKAIADYSKAIELDPRDAVSASQLAWLLATCPNSKLRDPGRAVQLARRAIELAPKEGDHWNNLGVALYRTGDWKTAIEVLDKSRQYRQGGDAHDFFFLAMAHCQLAHKDDALKWYKRAAEWVEKNNELLANNPRWRENLRRFRLEADELLGMSEKKK